MHNPNRPRGGLVRVLAFVVSALVLADAARAQLVRTAAGANAAAITPSRDQFRLDLGGGTTAGANGSFGGLRREINWDGVPAGSSAPNNIAGNFFNSNSPRGVEYTTPGTGFQVSANAGVAPIEFDNVDPSYSADFAPFSAQKLFTSLGSNVTDVNFFVPGTSTPAVVHGFGSVFTDVDRANTTSMQYFDAGGTSLGTFFVPASIGDESLSFLGVSFANPVVARVRITSGNVALAPGVTDQQGDLRDLVVMDDWLYSEPVPEPGALGLIACVASAFMVRRKR